jgi:peptidoglycan/LPS O-acetylase OafA/YrhL
VDSRQRLGYQPALDGVRCIAVLSVVGFHYYRWPMAGSNGVTIFFVLSGFLITTLLREEWQRYDAISLSKFYMRRALRLVPALVFFLLIYSAVGLLVHRTHWSAVLYGITYTMNFVLAFGNGGSHSHPLTHLWSLATEEQFYLVWPLLLILMLHRGLTTLRIFALTATAALALLLFRDLDSIYQLFHFRFDALLIGCCAALLFSSRHRPRLAAVCSAPPVAAAAFVLVLFELWHPPLWQFPIGGGLSYAANPLVVEVSVAVLLVWIVEGAHGFRPFRWLLQSPPFVYIGRISYALYLWHTFVLTMLLHQGFRDVTWVRPIGIAGALLVSSISYYCVERPFLRMKWRIARTQSHDVEVGEAIRVGLPEGEGKGATLAHS